MDGYPVGSSPVNQTLTVRHGISGTFWQVEPSIVDEVQAAFRATLGRLRYPIHRTEIIL